MVIAQLIRYLPQHNHIISHRGYSLFPLYTESFRSSSFLIFCINMSFLFLLVFHLSVTFFFPLYPFTFLCLCSFFFALSYPFVFLFGYFLSFICSFCPSILSPFYGHVLSVLLLYILCFCSSVLRPLSYSPVLSSANYLKG